MTRWWFYRWQMVLVAFMFMVFLTTPATSQPQTNILITACSQANHTNLNLQNFYANLNSTFQDVRTQLSNNNTYFATAEQTRNSEAVYVMGQCRNYMSTMDCVACFDFADRVIRFCAGANGGRVVLDGCFLRWTFIYLLFSYCEYRLRSKSSQSRNIYDHATCGLYCVERLRFPWFVSII